MAAQSMQRNQLSELAAAVEAMGTVLEELLAVSWAKGTLSPRELGRMRVLAKVAHDTASLVGKELKKP
jgi:hypothetical protein